MRRIGVEKSAKLNVTIDQRMMDRLDALVDKINRLNLLGLVDRSAVTREVLRHGLDSMERHVDTAGSERQASARKTSKRPAQKGTTDAA